MKRCVVVGCGQRGINSYIKPIMSGHLSDVAKVVGIYDIVRARADLCSEEYGSIPVYDDFDLMLSETSPDFVIVTTIDSKHEEYIIRSLRQGYDVISEKPMTTSRGAALNIMRAEKESGHKVRVTFNMRYMKPFADFKRIIMDGAIGEVLHSDLIWFLDRQHGADYFRRWHRYLENTNSLLIHKSTHHFDVISWIMGNKIPRSVFAHCFLDVYGKNGEYRAECCHKCEHTDKCPFYFDLSANEFYKKYYLDIEDKSGYYRDGCVFSEDIDIFDRMCLNVSYCDGATLNYSLIAYAPDEGFKINLFGTKGRAELTQYYSGPNKNSDLKIKVYDLSGNEITYETSVLQGDHGGADDLLRDDIFRGRSEDPLGQIADSLAGYHSLAIGDMAVMSTRLGKEVFIDELGD
jgi:predicted dehydrogenase